MNDNEVRKYVREHYGEVAIGKKVHRSAARVEDSACCVPQEAASC
jgi:hypothetical protein